MSSHKETAKQVVEKIGGRENVNQAWHCVTRLRFNVNDREKVQVEDIKKINGVMGAQFSGDQFQVIIGNKVADVFAEVESLVGGLAGGERKGEKQGVVSLVMDFISGIFSPILPALAGAGLLKGFIALFVTLGWLSTEGDTYQVLNAIGDSVFYFMPFFLAVSSARKIRTNEYLALTVAGTLMYPTFINAYNELAAGGQVQGFDLFGLGIINIPIINYASSVIPIILSVILLKYVYEFVKKFVPSAVSLMFSSMIALLIVMPLAFWLIGPLGTNIGNMLSGIFAWLFEHAGPVGGLLMAGLMPIIVMTGMHYAFAPIAIQNLSQFGYDNIISPMMFISNLAQGGAAFGVAVRTKNKQLKQLAVSAGISAIVGITEPAMYGVNMKLKKPLIYAMISSGILGAFAGWYGFKTFTMSGLVGIFTIPAFADPSGAMGSLIFAIIIFALSIMLPFIMVIILGFEDLPEDGAGTAKPAAEKDAQAADKTEEKKAAATGKQVIVQSPLKGTIVPLAEVSDPTFAQEIMGKGIAIEPDENRVVAPVSGSIMVLPDSQHAVGIKGDNGEEILIHVGIDTVTLKGKHFKGLVNEGDSIEVGQTLIEFDREAIRKEDLQTVTMMIVTNTSEYLDVLAINQSGTIFEGEQLLTLVK
ncbi:beta-glucoside-specific PTS transporter subunit IIABC [Peribacillus frigoritolerans]|uniref:beta-glucoside-specific PTS transporter subunit IIABC n=1 Tax=Peribacillus frigoritolerans TaxID=450367 RepID=UPI002281A498|nr:beta-glucoside-specific PTS transporter subunit IIABC [Peribacillus frigoritolerans]MCY9006504.1 beta-glucoside-specific PTS transporter subunit IIABC [Peribacillus frigoritolerans]